MTASPSAAGPALLGGLFARGAAAPAATDEALLQAMLDVEAALARAWARAGAISPAAAEAIAGACRAERFDVSALAAEAARHAQPVVGLVAALREAVGPPAAADVHGGATSQDVLDSALMLVARRAVPAILADLQAAAAAAAALAQAHAATPMTGRTLLQPAVATTFGLKAAGWMTALDDAADALARVWAEVLAVQLGGPVGSLDAPGVVQDVGRQLDLVAPVLPWHADRRRPAELATGLALAAGASAKVARDVTLLAQGEVGEVREGGAGGRSSSMPHKRNPVAAVSALACAQRVPGLVATILAGMAQEHERAAGAWQAEWPTLLELLRSTGSAVAWIAELAQGLEVDADRMAANLAHLPAPAPDTGPAAALVGRALAARRERAQRLRP
jgi:3-carboxy-cis,cis-muconate cycloisomerase